MSHVAHTNESCRTYKGVMPHITWVMPYVWMTRVKCTKEMAHIWMSHGTHINSRGSASGVGVDKRHMAHGTWHMAHGMLKESCHMYEWAMSHVWMGHVTHMNESCHTYDYVMWHIWMSHVTHMNESCCTYEWVMSHIWMSPITHMNESRHTVQVGSVFINGTWHAPPKERRQTPPLGLSHVCICVCSVSVSICVAISVSMSVPVSMFVSASASAFVSASMSATAYVWLSLSYRVAQSHRMPYLYRSFSANEPYN